MNTLITIVILLVSFIYYTFIIILNIFNFCPKSNKKIDKFH